MAARTHLACSGALTRALISGPLSASLIHRGITFERRTAAICSSACRSARLFNSTRESFTHFRPSISYTTSHRHSSNQAGKSNPTSPRSDGVSDSQQSPKPKQPFRAKLRERLQKSIPRENIYTLPNILTFSRLVSTPVIGYFIVSGQPYAACALFAYAGVTDLLDGWIARRWHLQTVVGTVIDPLADKTLMTVLTVCLAVKGALPIWLATLILGRDASLAIAAIYYRFASLPRPRTFARYWDFSLPSAEVHPTNISKLNTLLQLLLIGLAISLPLVADAGVSEVAVPLPTMGTEGEGGWVTKVGLGRAMEMAQWTVATTTVWSGLSYLYTRDAVKILGDEMEKGRKRGIVRRGRVILGLCFVGCAGIAVGLERVYAGKESGSREDKRSDERESGQV